MKNAKLQPPQHPFGLPLFISFIGCEQQMSRLRKGNGRRTLIAKRDWIRPTCEEIALIGVGHGLPAGHAALLLSVWHC